MHKETKALLQENNQRETLLSPNFQSVLTDMVVYLRAVSYTHLDVYKRQSPVCPKRGYHIKKQ